MEQLYGPVLSNRDYLFLDSFFKQHFNDAFFLNLTRVHGFMSAIISSPTIVKPSEWTPIILGQEPDFDSVAQAEKVMDLLFELYKKVSSELKGVEPYQLLLWTGEGIETVHSCSDAVLKDWCHGYLEGVKLDPLWETDSYAVSMLTPFSLFAKLPVKPSASSSVKIQAESQQRNQECMYQYRIHLADFVEDNYAYWLNEREEEIRLYNEKQKTQTNCPCGSLIVFEECMCRHGSFSH